MSSKTKPRSNSKTQLAKESNTTCQQEELTPGGEFKGPPTQIDLVISSQASEISPEIAYDQNKDNQNEDDVLD